MNNRKVAVGCAVAVAALAGMSATAGRAAAEAAPEVHYAFVGSSLVKFTVDTHDREFCVAHGWTDRHYNGDQLGTTTQIDGPATYLVQTTSFQITCPDGSHSPKITVYGPRNPINDLRTQFNDRTQGAFGS
ncbi:hypothetical protein nbrc107696_23640 [Gordonia spumicola]|uniref:Lipoprotein n=1 Tax=Gordonia spumicola TaxID=589161 RepID=A0A7I9V951_9ACTN|nr:hypothetical protein [Gordonia spumicola]GEE01918.1 hypothetical protein nbrc107696_23640 [Gordonia spumicola]